MKTLLDHANEIAKVYGYRIEKTPHRVAGLASLKCSVGSPIRLAPMTVLKKVVKK